MTWVNGEPVIGKPKTKAGIRDIHIPPHISLAVTDHLRDHVAAHGDALLFPNGYGGNIHHRQFGKHWNKARKAAGRPDLRFHDLRHTGAVLAAQSGATLAELMQRLGHSTPGAAMVYQHVAQGRDVEIAKRLSQIAGFHN